MANHVCGNCKGELWVCEEHPDHPFSGEYECGCGAAGAPCPVCEPSLAASGYVVRIIRWLEAEAIRTQPDTAAHLMRDIARRIEAAEYLTEEERQKARPFIPPRWTRS